jgi:iron complex outermembrane receptor protein
MHRWHSRRAALSGAALSVLVFALGGGTAAWADTAADAAASADAASADADVGLSEVVVTAQKRETNLQKTPISISVLNTVDLEDRHVQSLVDLATGGAPSERPRMSARDFTGLSARTTSVD